MADPKKRLEANVAGPWYVDRTCIDCDACRQLAPDTFDAHGGYSVVARQPETEAEIRNTMRALVACPVGSIGVEERVTIPSDLFPQPLDEAKGVYYCGFNSEDSYGANSFFVHRRDGNFLVDSPRWTRHLARAFEEHGGVSDILLTHRDDVADAHRYREAFGARVWIHEADRRAAPYATDLLDGEEITPLREGLIAIPVPGHTRGSVMYLLDDTFLFSGDSLYWSRHRKTLHASSTYCWYSWERQVESLRRLVGVRFEWILPGHGDRAHLPAERMREHLESFLERAAA